MQPDGQGCLPEVLPHDTNGDSTCSVLVLLSNPGQAAGCANVMGLAPAPAEVALRLSELEPSVVPGHPLCTLQQIAKTRWVDGTCTTFPSPGWCYVDGPAAGASCPQAIRFSNGAPPIGAMTWLACP